jgi:hypothetical protein
VYYSRGAGLTYNPDIDGFVRSFALDEFLENETGELVRSWEDYDWHFLADYLVKDVQDPRINIQSILSRHFLIDKLFGDWPSYLMDHEIRFSLVVNWLMRLIKGGVIHDELSSFQDALFNGESSSLGLEIPGYISETFQMLSVENYVCDMLTTGPPEDEEKCFDDYLLNTFGRIWAEELQCRGAERVSVIEPACGSANDFRFIESFGISRFVDYAGFELCDNNVYNALSMFPDVDFKAGNVLEIDREDDAYEYCFVHDLFEHLSVEAMEVAIAEVCRVTKKQACVHFFNMSDSDEHVVEKTGHYHWNMLSCDKTKEVFLRHASKVEVVCIDDFLAEKYNCSDTHNKDAYTFYVSI